MKVRFSIVVLIMVVSSNYAGIDLGIKGGLSLYEARSEYGQGGQTTSIYYGYRIGPSVTVFGEIEQNKNLFHSVQINYYQAGGKAKTDITNEFGTITGKGWDDLAINYIGLGYNFGYKLPLSVVVPYASIGFSADYLINIQDHLIYNGKTVNFNSYDGYTLNRINIRPLISAGIQYQLSGITLLLEYVFSYNLLPFYQHAVDAESIGAKHTTSGNMINIGCKFKIK